MNEKPKETRARVYLRRAVLAALDAAIVAFSFYFALLLRADGAVEAAWWPHNLAILYRNLPWIVAVYVASFLLGGLYSVLWKYAGERDLLRLAVMVAVPTGIVYAVNRRCIHGVLFNSANCMAAVLILLLVGGSRLAWRLFLNHPLGERLRGAASRDPNRPVMIVGAGEAGAWAINVCKTNKQYGRPVLAVDDDPAKLHQTIHGVPVKGTLAVTGLDAEKTSNLRRKCFKSEIKMVVVKNSYDYFSIAATPGNTLPSIASRRAPPPVEI